MQHWPGTGRSWLLLHGAGASAHSWRGLAPLLAAGGDAVLVPDLPGHGFSSSLPRGCRSMDGMAAALGALLHTVGLAQATVVGHSAGAALMLRAVLDARLAASQLVGLNAALLPFEGLAGISFRPLARCMAAQPLAPALLAWAASDPRSVDRVLRATGSALDADGSALYARLMRRRAHVAGVLQMMADWSLERLGADLPRLRTPLTLIVADGDRTVPPAQALRLAERLPAVRVRTLEGLGHLAHEESPHRVAALLSSA